MYNCDQVNVLNVLIAISTLLSFITGQRKYDFPSILFMYQFSYFVKK